MMKRFRTYNPLFLAIALLVSACGAEQAPTLSAVDVQSTAVAAAFTLVAQTQAAIPTNTPIPPTETATNTPPPTDTPVSLPTLQTLATVAPVSNNPNGAATVDPCSTRVLSSPPGRETQIKIVNTTRVPIKVSIYLNETLLGGCGWGYVELGRNSDTTITSWVEGCYNIWAWSDDPRGRFNSSGYGCVNNSDKWTFEVTDAVVRITPP